MGTIIGEGITFDDVLLVPQYSEVTPNMIDLKTNLTKKIVLNILRHLFCTRENPEISGAPASDKRIPVIGIYLHDTVIGIEWAKKRYAQKPRIIRPLALPDSSLRFAGLDSGIDDFYRTVLVQRIDSFRVLHTSLKRMIKPRDFVPNA